ncbi:MAG: TonB-dependent receptor [Halioglobus sp.]
MPKNNFRFNLIVAAGLGLPIAVQAAQLEEIVVTATKREAGLMDTPTTVSAFTGEEMRHNGIRDFQDLSVSIPNVTVSQGRAGLTTVNIRGLQSGVDGSFESSVGIFIDGIYYPRTQAAFSPMFDVARAEVLKGPQAVLYGLNSTAGVLNIHSQSNNPGDAFEATVVGNYEVEHEGYSWAAFLGGGLSDSLGARLAIRTFDDGDGFLENVATGEDTHTSDGIEARLSLVWQPTDAITSTFKWAHADIDSEGNNLQQLNNGRGEDKLNWKIESDGNGSREAAVMGVAEGVNTDDANKEIDAISWKTDFDIGDSVLSVNLGYNDMEWGYGFDLDGSATNAPAIFSTRDENHEQQSIELQFTSPAGETFEYILGAYYSDATTEIQTSNVLELTLVVPSVPAVAGISEYGNLDYEVDTEVLSAYGNLTWNISDSMRLTGGLRYTDETKDLTRDPNGLNCQWYDAATATFLGPAQFNVFCSKLSNFTDDKSSENVMPELIGQWDWSDDTMLYAKISTAVKSGGFAAAVSPPTPESVSYDDEEALGFELGLKSDFADGAGRLSLALFRTEFTDLQVNSFDENTASAFVTNAGEATSQGIELDVTYAATDSLVLGAALGLLDAEYDKYLGSACPANISVEETATRCNLAGGTQDSAGQDLANAPEWSGNAYAALDYPFTSSGIRLVGKLNLSFTDDYITEVRDDPFFAQDGYTRVDASIGVAASDDRWRVSLIGSNLTEEEVQDGGTAFLGYNIVSVNRPRTVLLQAQYRFGDL